MDNAMKETLDAARTTINTLVRDIGEENFADLVEGITVERLRTAVGRLQSTPWWQETLTDALMNPASYNNTLLCKLIDKAVPTQQAVKIGADEGFRLLVEMVPVEEDPSPEDEEIEES